MKMPRCCACWFSLWKFLLGLVFTIFLAGSSSGIVLPSWLPPNRVIDWTPGVSVGVPGGIPNRTNIFVNVGAVASNSSYWCDTNGVIDCTSNLENALNACPSNQVVYLPAGNYLVGQQLQTYHSYFTLRGAGMGKTILHATHFYLNNSDSPTPSPTLNITNGYLRGSTVLYVDSTNGVVVNRLCTITETNPPTVWENTNTMKSVPPNAGHDNTRFMAITVLIVGVNSNSVTIDHPLPIDMTNAPMITLWSHYLQEFTGIEDLTMDMSSSSSRAAIEWYQTYGCWLKDVEVTNAYQREFWLQTAANDEIRSCYVHNQQGPSGPNHEGIDLVGNCCYCLVENNIGDAGGYPMIILGDENGGCSCNVVGYNYLINEVGPGTNPSTPAGYAISDNHGPQDIYNLIEGNVAQNYASDGYFGSSSQGTLFRNYFSGYFDPGTYIWPFCITLDKWSDDYNVVGNVLGTPGWSDWYQPTNASYSGYSNVIYRIGYPNIGNSSYGSIATNSQDPNAFDMNVQMTLLRTGNYDYANKATIWDSNGVQTLPASLYYTNEPTWWTNYGNTSPWPPIGPDVAGMTNLIPAEVRFEHLTDPSSTGTNSFIKSSAISPPSNLRVIRF